MAQNTVQLIREGKFFDVRTDPEGHQRVAVGMKVNGETIAMMMLKPDATVEDAVALFDHLEAQVQLFSMLR